MELIVFARILRHYWWLVLIPTAVVAALTFPTLLNRAAVSGGFATMIRYSAAQKLDAIPDRDGDYQDVWLASELTVNALTDWVTSSTFKNALVVQAAAQGVTVDPAALGIAADNERSVGQVFLAYPDADGLTAIAGAAIHVLQTQNQRYFAQLGGEPAQVTILDEPIIASAPPPLTDRFAPLIRIALGLVVGVGLALLAHYLDPMLRRREEVEALGMSVLASIPRR